MYTDIGCVHVIFEHLAILQVSSVQVSHKDCDAGFVWVAWLAEVVLFSMTASQSQIDYKELDQEDAAQLYQVVNNCVGMYVVTSNIVFFAV